MTTTTKRKCRGSCSCLSEISERRWSWIPCLAGSTEKVTTGNALTESRTVYCLGDARLEEVGVCKQRCNPGRRFVLT